MTLLRICPERRITAPSEAKIAPQTSEDSRFRGEKRGTMPSQQSAPRSDMTDEQRRFHDQIAYVERRLTAPLSRKLVEGIFDIATEKAAADRTRYEREVQSRSDKEAKGSTIVRRISEFLLPSAPPEKPCRADSQYSTYQELEARMGEAWQPITQGNVVRHLIDAGLLRQVVQGGTPWGGGVLLGIEIDPRCFAAIERVLLTERAAASRALPQDDGKPA